jgi:hypothetical protein
MRKLTFFFLFLLTQSGCGQNCTFINKLFNEPSCHNLNLSASKSVDHFYAPCSAATHSRKIIINCAASSGSQQQCTSSSTALPVYAVLVPNNTSGNFTDTDGTVYTNCNDLLTGLDNNLVQNVSAVYYSDNSDAADTLECTDAGGCTLTPQVNCFAGWNSTNGNPQGTASLPAGGQYLSCVYIDNYNQPDSIPPIAVGDWSSPMYSITITGDLNFNSGWGDAY